MWTCRRPMTCRSCIASSMAAWVLGGVRLISSARIMLANSGPGQKLVFAGAGLQIFLNHFRAGDVAGHQVGRELDALERQMQCLGQRTDQQRLGQAGHAFEQRMAAGEDRHQHLLDHFVLADDHLGQLVANAVVGLFAPLHGGDVVGRNRGCGGGHRLGLPERGCRLVSLISFQCSRSNASNDLRKRAAPGGAIWPAWLREASGGSFANQGSSFDRRLLASES